MSDFRAIMAACVVEPNLRTGKIGQCSRQLYLYEPRILGPENFRLGLMLQHQ